MRNRKQLILIRASYIVIDMALIMLAFYLACLLRPGTLPFSVTWQAFVYWDENPYRFSCMAWLLTTLLFNQIQGLYQTRREMLETFEVWEVIKSILFSSLVFIVLSYLWKTQDFPRSVLIISIVLMSIFLSLWRIAKKVFVEYLVANGYNNFNALIIGAGKVGTLLHEEIKKRPGLGVRVVGFLDDYKNSPPGKNVRILGKVSDFHAIAKREFINEVFITVHYDSNVFMQVLEEAKEHQIAVRVVPQGFELMNNDLIKYNLGIVPILAYSDVEINYRHRGKRLFDFILSLFALVMIVPVFMVIAILVKLESPGPVFYSSKRYGRGGRIFNMYKFRSMVHNADAMLKDLKDKNEVDGPIFKIKNDPRITRMGRFLRKYSLDELPQVVNVLKGNMSLVGPRPLPIEQIEKEDLRQLKRLDIRPGITGLWQIRGRSDLAFDRLVKWDIWYINNWSFSLDLYILVQTIPVVLHGRGAY